MDSGGKIFATQATCELCNIMLKDSAHIQMFEAEWRNRKAKRAGKPEVVPLYNMDDAQGVLEHFVPCAYETPVQVTDDLKIRFVDAGHLLGSSSIEIWIREDGEEKKTCFFRGYRERKSSAHQRTGLLKRCGLCCDGINLWR